MEELSTKGAFTLSQGALTRLREEFDSGRSDEDETAATIAAIRTETGLVIDPHTAIGVKAAADVRGDPAVPMVVLGTAHAAKFPDAVEDACGVRPDLPPRMADLFDKPERVQHAPNDLFALQTIIRKGIRA